MTDVLQIAANGLPTVRTCDLLPFLKDYLAREPVDEIIMGYPRTVKGEDSESMTYIRPFLKRLEKELPEVPVKMYDERFTSVLAHRAMLDGGMKKSQRQEKGQADEIAAVILLTDYLQSRR